MIDFYEYYLMMMKGLFYGLSPIIIVLIFLMLSQRIAFKRTIDAFGYKFVVLTGVVGTSLHELSHAIMCVVFKHKIKEIKFFKPDGDGTLGYVNFSYNPMSLYQRVGLFFVGLAPFFMALVYFFGSTYLLLRVNLLQSSGGALSYSIVIEDLVDFLYIITHSGVYGFYWSVAMFAIVLHMMPSPQDLKGARTGGFSIGVLYLVSISVLFVSTGDVDWVHEKIFDWSMIIVLYLSKLVVAFTFFLALMWCVSSAWLFVKPRFR